MFKYLTYSKFKTMIYIKNMQYLAYKILVKNLVKTNTSVDFR